MPCPRLRLAPLPVLARTDTGEPEPVSPVYAGPAGPRPNRFRHFERRHAPELRARPRCFASETPRRGIKPVTPAPAVLDRTWPRLADLSLPPGRTRTKPVNRP